MCRAVNCEICPVSCIFHLPATVKKKNISLYMSSTIRLPAITTSNKYVTAIMTRSTSLSIEENVSYIYHGLLHIYHIKRIKKEMDSKEVAPWCLFFFSSFFFATLLYDGQVSRTCRTTFIGLRPTFETHWIVTSSTVFYRERNELCYSTRIQMNSAVIIMGYTWLIYNR